MINPSRVSLISMASVVLLAPQPAPGQVRGAFIARLGTDTVHIERFERDGNKIAGTILQRTPTFRVIRWTMSLDADGNPVRYEASGTDAAGAPLLNGVSGSLEFGRDSVVRTAYRNGQMETQRLAAPNGAVPSPGLPYVGVTYLSYEWAFAALRRRLASGGDTALYQLSMFAAQPAPSKTRAWVVGTGLRRAQLLRRREEWIQVRPWRPPRRRRLDCHHVSLPRASASPT